MARGGSLLASDWAIAIDPARRDGRIVAHHVGPYDWSNADIREALQELIKSKQG